MDELHLKNPELVAEYLASLQDQLDSLQATNERLRARIGQLEAERSSLRDRRSRLRRATVGRERGLPPTDNTVTVPGVGVIPDPELPEGPVSRPNLVVGTVLDEFSRSAFRYEFDLRDLPAIEPEQALETHSPDLLLAESAYRGDGSWAGRIARFGRPSSHLQRVVDWCKSHGVPTVFWVKEDPINHDWFIASASLFDVVLTVDSNMVDLYRRRLEHQRVGVLPFGAQPVIHHPPVEVARPGAVAFAGSYYAAKHSQRRVQMEYVLEPALEFGLHIFDRMDRQHDPRFAWPEKYKQAIVGSLTYAQTLEIYRRYQTFLNVNTVTDSPTMCARRIYELLASGTRVVSGPAAALEGVPVEVTHSADETRNLLSSESTFDAAERAAWVNSEHTMWHRMETILQYL